MKHITAVVLGLLGGVLVGMCAAMLFTIVFSLLFEAVTGIDIIRDFIHPYFGN